MRTNTRYIVLLSVLTLTLLLSQLFLQSSISRSQKDSYIINVSGRQRMLSQKITKHALQLRSRVGVPDWDRIIPELNETLADWENGLHYLTKDEGASLANEKVRQLFDQTIPYFSRIKSAALELNQMHQSNNKDIEATEDLINTIESNEDHFLNLMDEITYELDLISQEKISWYERSKSFFFPFHSSF